MTPEQFAALKAWVEGIARMAVDDGFGRADCSDVLALSRLESEAADIFITADAESGEAA